MVYKNKKKMQMAMYAVVGILLFMVLRKNPARGRTLLLQANEAIKYMPIDKQCAGILSPILDFTMSDSPVSSFIGNAFSSNQSSSGNIEQRVLQQQQQQQQQQPQQGGDRFGVCGTSGTSTTSAKSTASTKRSVSETKKKYVASMQEWNCGDCRHKLNAWFEVDHKIRLEHGGNNDVGNLVALCRNCHGKKTAFENM